MIVCISEVNELMMEEKTLALAQTIAKQSLQDIEAGTRARI